MLIGAAVCPHPPLLVPELAGDIAHELDDLRAACEEAIRRVLAADPDLLVVVGMDESTRDYGSAVAGSLQPYGLDLTVGPGEPVLPLSLTIGGWLLAGARGLDVRFQGVAWDAAPAECLRLGRALTYAAERVALLVMGDGAACREEKAPGYLDARAEPYDAEVARALGQADAAALAALDPGLSGELQVAGRAAWQVLAGAAGAGVGERDRARPVPGQGVGQGVGHALNGTLLADMAPYGVGYLVANWLRDDP